MRSTPASRHSSRGRTTERDGEGGRIMSDNYMVLFPAVPLQPKPDWPRLRAQLLQRGFLREPTLRRPDHVVVHHLWDRIPEDRGRAEQRAPDRLGGGFDTLIDCRGHRAGAALPHARLRRVHDLGVHLCDAAGRISLAGIHVSGAGGILAGAALLEAQQHGRAERFPGAGASKSPSRTRPEHLGRVRRRFVRAAGDSGTDRVCADWGS